MATLQHLPVCQECANSARVQLLLPFGRHEERFNLGCGGLLHMGEHVGVNIQGKRSTGMPEHLGDYLRLNSSCEREGCRSVSKIVEPEGRGQIRRLEDPNEILLGHVSLVQGKHGALTHENLARTLLVKRPAFRHEREIRLLFTPHDFHNFKERIVRYPADPNMLLDQIMLDPRMDEAKAAVLKRRIEDAGFSGSVKRSLLYAPPPDLQITWNPRR